MKRIRITFHNIYNLHHSITAKHIPILCQTPCNLQRGAPITFQNLCNLQRSAAAQRTPIIFQTLRLEPSFI